jgi:hypothetical protein
MMKVRHEQYSQQVSVDDDLIRSVRRVDGDHGGEKGQEQAEVQLA